VSAPPLYDDIRKVYSATYNAWMRALNERGGLDESTRLLANAAQTIAQAAEHCAPPERDQSQPDQAAPASDPKRSPVQTCASCGHFTRCEWLLSRAGTETGCDWSPSKYREAEVD
jgi:hypothetical protein